MRISHLNFQIYSVIEISKPKHMMELVFDAKHTFLTKIKTFENIKEILIPPVTNKKNRTHFYFAIIINESGLLAVCSWKFNS